MFNMFRRTEKVLCVGFMVIWTVYLHLLRTHIETSVEPRLVTDVKYVFCVESKKGNDDLHKFLRIFWKNNFNTSNSGSSGSQEAEVLIKKRSKLFFIHTQGFWNNGTYILGNVTDETGDAHDTCDTDLKNKDNLLNNCLFHIHTLYSQAEFFTISRDSTFVNFRNIVRLLEVQGMQQTFYGSLNPKLDIDSSLVIYHKEVMKGWLHKFPATSPLITYRERLYSIPSRIVPLQGILTTDAESKALKTTACDLFTRHVLSQAQFTLEQWRHLQNQSLECKEKQQPLTFWTQYERRAERQWRLSTEVSAENPSHLAVCEKPLDVLIMVHSHPNNVQKRVNTRKTWASPAYGEAWPGNRYTLKTKLIFILGTVDGETSQKVKDEDLEYNDIVQGGFTEHYANLTRKHMFALHWISQHCKNVTYVLKTDDDVMVNLPLFQHVIQISPLRRSVIGLLTLGTKTWNPVRKRSKWTVSKAEYPFDKYPYTVPGTSYLLTRDTVEDLVAAAEYIPYYRFDDIFVPGILARVVGMNHVLLQQRYLLWPKKTVSVQYKADTLYKDKWMDTYWKGNDEKDRLRIWEILQSKYTSKKKKNRKK